MPEEQKVPSTISVQKTYNLYFASSGIMTCDEVIDIPLACTVTRYSRIDNNYRSVMPCVEIIAPDNIPDLKIITNEGITVEPLTIQSSSSINPYKDNIFYIVLPFGTTGIKKVVTDRKKLALEFSIMPPPYNYESMLFGIITQTMLGMSRNINELSNNLNNLDDRVDTFESKTNGLKVVTNTPSITSTNIPKGAGKQGLAVPKGTLFYDLDFNYTSSSSAVHSPKITVSDGRTNTVYTLSLHKSVSVRVDLLTGTITAYDKTTGEIVQQLKIFGTTYGYESIDFEDFNDISDSSLYVRGTGRSVK